MRRAVFGAETPRRVRWTNGAGSALEVLTDVRATTGAWDPAAAPPVPSTAAPGPAAPPVSSWGWQLFIADIPQRMRFSHLPGVGRLLLCLDGALTLEREHGGESAVPKSGAALAFQGDERIVGRPESTAAAGTTAAATTTTTTHAISSDGEVDKHPMCRSFGVLYRRDCYRDASMTLVSGGSTGSGVVAAPCCVIHAPSRNRAAVVLRCAGGVGCAVDADIVLMPGETLVTSGSVAATCGGSGDVVALCGFTPAATSKL